MRYYISDLHYFHRSMNVRMDNRGFESVDAMNQYMIKQWNSRVKRNDEVVILGDFSIGRAKETEEVLKSLNGKKYLVIGNHDKFLRETSFNKSLFANISPYMELNDNKRKVILCHYPVFCYNGQYRTDDKGMGTVFMLHGHVHDTYDQALVDRFIKETQQTRRKEKDGKILNIPCNMLNCFCKWSDYIPLTLDEWILFHDKRLRENFPVIQPAIS